MNLVDGGSAMALRGVRHGATARANGHLLRNVVANGPVTWVNDANSQNELDRETWQHLGRDLNEDDSLPLRWDVNPAAGELAPPDGWVHPFIFYQCKSGDRSYGHTLVNADVGAGKALGEIDLAGMAR